MAKDRSAPFSRKHRKYWLPVTGGMILIGLINLLLGYCAWPDTPMDHTPDAIQLKLPVSPYERRDAGADAGDAADARDAGDARDARDARGASDARDAK